MTKSRYKSDRWLLYSSIILLLMASFFAYQAFKSFKFISDLIQKGSITIGKVIDVTEERGRYNVNKYCVEYIANNQTHHISNDFTSNNNRYKVGEVVTVIYSPQAPDTAIIDDTYERNVWSFKALISIGFFLFSYLFYRAYRSSN